MTQFNVRGLAVNLSYNIKNLKKAQEFSDNVDNIRAGMENLTAMARKAAIGMTAFTGGLVVAGNQLGKTASEIERNATALGVATGDYQELAYAFERLDLNANDLMDTMTQVADRVQSASTGSKNYQEALGKLGLSHEKLMVMNPAQALLEVVNATRGLENHMERAAIAATLLGEESARKLLPSMNKNGKALKEYMDLARQSGVVMDRTQIKKARQMSEAFENVRLVMRSIRNQFILALAPAMERYSRIMVEAYLRNKEFIGQKIDEYADRIYKAYERLYGLFRGLNKVVQGMGGWTALAESLAQALALLAAGKFVSWMASIGMAVKGLAGFFTGLGGVLSAKLIVAVVALIGFFVMLAGALEEIIAHKQGAKTLTATLRKNFEKLTTPLKVLVSLWFTFVEVVGLWFNIIKGMILPIVKKLLPYLKMLGFVILAVIGIVGIAMALFVAFGGLMVGLVLGAIYVVIRVIHLLGEALSALVVFLFDALVAIATELYEFLNAVITASIAFLGWAAGIWDEFVDGVAEGVIAAVDGMWEAFFSLWGIIKEVLGTLMKFPVKLLDTILGGHDIENFVDQFSLDGRKVNVPSPSSAGVGRTPSTAGMGARGNTSNSNVNQNMTQQTTVNVNGVGDPGAVASKVADRQKAVADSWANSSYQNARQGNR